MDKCGALREKKTFKGFHDTKRILNTDKYFNLRIGENFMGEFTLPLKRPHGRRIIIEK